MKKSVIQKMAIAAGGIMVLIILAFGLGHYMAEQQCLQQQTERCRTMISFAMDKLEKTEELDRPTIMALASNLYAARSLCDDVQAEEVLNQLWNMAVFSPEKLLEERESVQIQLADLLTRLDA